MPNEDPNGVVETWQINTKDDQSRCTGTCSCGTLLKHPMLSFSLNLSHLKSMDRQIGSVKVLVKDTAEDFLILSLQFCMENMTMRV